MTALSPLAFAYDHWPHSLVMALVRGALLALAVARRAGPGVPLLLGARVAA